MFGIDGEFNRDETSDSLMLTKPRWGAAIAESLILGFSISIIREANGFECHR